MSNTASWGTGTWTGSSPSIDYSGWVTTTTDTGTIRPLSPFQTLLVDLGLTRDQAIKATKKQIEPSDFHTFRIPKATGGMREIKAPQGDARAIQDVCLKLLERCNLAGSDAAHAYYHGRSIRSMAAPHVGHKWLIKIDLKDFFPNIPIRVVTAGLRRTIRQCRSDLSQHSHKIETLLLYWCNDATGNVTAGHRQVSGTAGLPMGAPTSPLLSNLVAGRTLDPRIIGLCRTFDIRGKLARPGRLRTVPIHYTRYADDLCLSSDYPDLPQTIPYIKNMIKAAGFIVNEKKIKVIRNSSRQVICGVSVNEHVGKPKSYRQALRMELYRTAINTALGRCPAGMKFEQGNSENLIPVNIDKLAGAVEHVRFLNETQARPLVELLTIVKDVVSVPEADWQVATHDWVERKRHDNNTTSVQHS